MAADRRQRIENMLRDAPDDAELRYMLAMEYVSEGNDEDAVKRFQEVFELSPDYAPAYHQGGRALQRLNRVDEARDVLLRGIAAARMTGNDHAAGEMQELLENLLQ